MNLTAVRLIKDDETTTILVGEDQQHNQVALVLVHHCEIISRDLWEILTRDNHTQKENLLF